jgi:cyclophilin family peptidyl-prolyl cis-trans isomerase
MIRRLLLAVAVFGLIFAGTGCSKDEGADQKSSAADTMKQQTPQSQAPQVPALDYDSLAAFRYPIKDKNNKFVTIATDFGNMTLELYRDVAPAHADSFLARSRDGFYNGTVFHRIIKRFMIQGGGPTGTGTGNAGYYLNAEFSDLPHQDGTLSMARSSDPNSASCEFFVCLERNRAITSLDKAYTVFGQLIKGYDVLHKIGAIECVANPRNPREVSKPKEDVYLRKAFESDAEGNQI